MHTVTKISYVRKQFRGKAVVTMCELSCIIRKKAFIILNRECDLAGIPIPCLRLRTSGGHTTDDICESSIKHKMFPWSKFS